MPAVTRIARQKPSIAWWLLNAIPIVAAALLLAPGFAAHGEGLLAEALGSELVDSDEFLAFALDVRLWCGAALVIACIVGLVHWWAMKRGWRARLSALKAEQVLRHKAYVSSFVLPAILIASVLGVALLLLPARFRGLAVPMWLLLGALCSAWSIAQYYCAIYGVADTRRTFRGK